MTGGFDSPPSTLHSSNDPDCNPFQLGLGPSMDSTPQLEKINQFDKTNIADMDPMGQQKLPKLFPKGSKGLVYSNTLGLNLTTHVGKLWQSNGSSGVEKTIRHCHGCTLGGSSQDL